jgi:hypothetical protein
VSKIYFNPIEYVPVLRSEYKSEEMNILNCNIRAKVSSFTIQYSWINMLELFNYNKKGTEVQFNPEMPLNGWQKNISIEWHFID